MPLRFDIEKYLGTNSDGSRSDEYCYYCLKDGKYIVDIPMSEMINIWIKYTDKYNEYADTAYSPKELRRILNERLPKLNRWKQKLETSNIHHQKIQDIVVYINNHLFDSLDADILSTISGLSKYHFRRVFQTVAGENIGSYIQRLRLEHIAHLLVSTDFTLNQISEQTNYQTKFSLAKAFKKHFGVSTSQYREKYKPMYDEQHAVITPEIRSILPMKVFCIEDDPAITPIDKCRFYLGVIIDNKENDFQPGVIEVPGGRYAIFRHIGDYSLLHKFYRTIYEEWFPESKYRPQSTFSFEMYMNRPASTLRTELITDIYIPVIKK